MNCFEVWFAYIFIYICKYVYIFFQELWRHLTSQISSHKGLVWTLANIYFISNPNQHWFPALTRDVDQVCTSVIAFPYSFPDDLCLIFLSSVNDVSVYLYLSYIILNSILFSKLASIFTTKNKNMYASCMSRMWL